MLFHAQRLSKFVGTALLATGLVACGGSDSTDAVKEAAAVTSESMNQAKEAVSGAGEMAKEAVESAGSAAKGAVEEAGSAAKGAIESAGANAKTAIENAGVAAAGAVAETASTIDLAAGEKTYGRFCFSCHAAGVAGAPKLGATEDWAPRVAKGLDMLVASTIEGIAPGMPARGLCMNCSDDDLRNTVAWMIAQ